MTPMQRPKDLPDETFAEWWEKAACKGMDPNRFFPEKGTNNQVKRVCATCPVRSECLNYGLWEPFGIWGGLSLEERKRIRPKMRNAIAQCGTNSGYYRHRDHGEDPCVKCRQAHTAAEAARERRARQKMERGWNQLESKLEPSWRETYAEARRERRELLEELDEIAVREIPWEAYR